MIIYDRFVFTSSPCKVFAHFSHFHAHFLRVLKQLNVNESTKLFLFNGGKLHVNVEVFKEIKRSGAMGAGR